MGLVNLILNLAALLLWLSWRAIRIESLSVPRISIVSNLRTTGRSSSRWIYFIALYLLLLCRAGIYYQLGTALAWIPNIPLGPETVLSRLASYWHNRWFAEAGFFPPTLFFRADNGWRIFAFTFLSFGQVLVCFYLGLLLLATVNDRLSQSDPMQRVVRLHLGWLDRWPVVLKLMLPVVMGLVAWLALYPVLLPLHLVPTAKSFGHILKQGAVMGLDVYVVWGYCLIGILFLYILNSYIYLGSMPFWNYINQTGRTLLLPLSWLPLQLGKIDLAPVVAILLIFLVSEFGHLGIALLYKKMAL